MKIVKSIGIYSLIFLVGILFLWVIGETGIASALGSLFHLIEQIGYPLSTAALILLVAIGAIVSIKDSDWWSKARKR